MIDQQLIDRVDVMEMFHYFMEASDPVRVLRITGDTKMGKSRLLREFMKIGRDNYNATCILLDLRSMLQSHDDIMYDVVQTIGFDYFLDYQKIYDVIYNHSTVEVSKVQQWFSTMSIKSDIDRSEYRIKRLLAAFLGDLRRFARDNKLILMFDAFDAASEEVQRWVNEKLISSLCHVPNSYLIL